MTPRVLVIDPEKINHSAFRDQLTRDGFEVWFAETVDEGQTYFTSQQKIDIIILSLDPSPSKSIAWMNEIKRAQSTMQFLVTSQKGDLRGAVEALRGGALNYFEAPFEMSQMSEAVGRSYAIQRHEEKMSQTEETQEILLDRLQRIEGKSEDQFWYVSRSRAFDSVNTTLTDLRRATMKGSPDEPPVMISGKFGTGKDAIARMVHAGSKRGKAAWMSIGCASLREDRLELELFGHERGAFEGAHTQKRGVFEIGSGGTLFLDDLEHLSPRLQAMFANVLKTKKFKRFGGVAELEFDMRVIVGTERELQFEIDRQKYNPALLDLLEGVRIHLPELRDRMEDLLPLATQYVERFYESRGKHFEGWTVDAENALHAYGWPGNVYELFNVVSRASVLSGWAPKISSSFLSFPSANALGERGSSAEQSPLVARPLGEVVVSGGDGDASYTQFKKRWSNSFEQEYLVAILSRHGGNVSASAREAKLDRSNFLRLLRKHNLSAEQYRKAA
jgi:DNA-binding NtrC family response regulator